MAGLCNLLCIIIMVFAIVTAIDYCNIKSCEKNSHTMCKYNSSKPAAACGLSSRTSLTDAEKKAIVNIHNELRQKVASGQEKRGKPGPQPKAVSMPKLGWDKELAIISQRWANQCIFGHDKCRNVEKYSVGQNVAQTSSSGKNTATVQYMIQLWYDEVKDFNRSEVEKYKHNPKTGHYTQTVWANTTRVGCGLIEYKDSKGWTIKNLVCNYGPSGNFIGQKIYTTKK